jgi:hypothetical protein
VAVPMGKCAEPTNVRAGGGACPIRYQCAACPHFESDPSFLPELRGYADDLRREREAMLSAGAADWVVANVTRQLDVITSHIHTHQGALDRLPGEQRAMIEEASATVRHVRRAVPVAFGPTRRQPAGQRRLTPVGPRLRQRDLAADTARAHEHRAGPAAFGKKNLQPLPLQRMERMSDNNKSRRITGRRGTMPPLSRCRAAGAARLPSGYRPAETALPGSSLHAAAGADHEG